MTTVSLPGGLVSSSAPILTLLDTTQMELHTTNLSERDLALIQPRQKAILTLKSYPDDSIEAVVIGIGWHGGFSK